MIDASIYDAYVDRIIFLLIHDLRHVISTGCGQEPSHLKYDIIRSWLLEQLHKLCQQTLILFKIILGKIRHTKTWTKFQHLSHKLFLFLQSSGEIFNVLYFPGNLFHDFFLGSCKILQPDHSHMRELLSVADTLCHICLAHTKLITAGHTKQQLHLTIQFVRTAAHQLQLTSGFCCIMDHTLLHGIAYILILLVHTGKNNLLHGKLSLHTDVKLSRRTHFISIRLGFQCFHQKRIGFDGKAQLRRMNHLFDPSGSLLQYISIKHKRRRSQLNRQSFQFFFCHRRYLLL